MPPTSDLDNKIISKKSIVYLVYGAPDVFYQVIFSILTLSYYIRPDSQEIEIVVYTNNEEILQKYLHGVPIRIELLSNETIRAYKGNDNFNHRIKILVIEHCISKYGTDIFYVDGDTFFLKDPRPLLNQVSENTSIMHMPEYDMQSTKSENQFKLNLRRTLEDPVLIDGKQIIIPLTTIMWNAGVIGMSYKNGHLLNKVLSVTDQLYRSRPVHTAEQFAFSYILQNNTKLISAEEYIKHYWNIDERRFVQNQFRRFLHKHYSKPLDEVLKNVHIFAQQFIVINLPPPTLLDRVKLRFNLIVHVALKGRLPQ